MEEKKSNKGLVIVLVILLLAFASVAILLGTGVVKSPFVKCEKCKDTTTTVTNTEKKETTEISSTSKFVIDVSKKVEIGYVGITDLGTISLDGKEYDVKYETNDNGGMYLYLGDKKIESGDVKFIAVMDEKYLVLDLNRDVITIYDSNLNKVEEVGDSRSFIDNNKIVKGTYDISNSIIDNKTMVYYKCDIDSNNEYDSTLKHGIIKFENGKYTKTELMTVENVFCAQAR